MVRMRVETHAGVMSVYWSEDGWHMSAYAAVGFVTAAAAQALADEFGDGVEVVSSSTLVDEGVIGMARLDGDSGDPE